MSTTISWNVRRWWLAAGLGLLGLCLAACGGGGEGGETSSAVDTGGPAPAARLSVHTSCFPVSYLAERVAGDRADVTLILPAGEDPPDWTPPAETISAMQGADLIVVNGAGFEGWVGTTTLPESKLVDTTASLPDPLIEVEETTHSHGKDGEHSHKGIDPHTWSDPQTAIAQAEAIQKALSRIDPSHTETYRANFEGLRAELTRLDQSFGEAVAGYGGEVLATSHPAFNYLGRRYGLKLQNFGFEPDELPGDDAFAAFTHEVEHHGLKRMLWEARPSDEVKARFEGAGVEVLFLDPLEQPQGEADYDYLKQAQANVERLKVMFPVPAAGAAGASE